MQLMTVPGVSDEADKTPAALAEAAAEVGLPDCYWSCVKPILSAPVERWPRCCGGGCEPCNEVLCEVARRVKAKLAAQAGEVTEAAPGGSGRDSVS
jgi:hypothetical protein